MCHHFDLTPDYPTPSHRPFGKLKVSIRACWVKDAKFDPETMTEVSGTSMFTDFAHSQPRPEPEEEFEEEQVCLMF